MKMPMSTSRLYEMMLHCLNQPGEGDTDRQVWGRDYLHTLNQLVFLTEVQLPQMWFTWMFKPQIIRHVTLITGDVSTNYGCHTAVWPLCDPIVAHLSESLVTCSSTGVLTGTGRQPTVRGSDVEAGSHQHTWHTCCKSYKWQWPLCFTSCLRGGNLLYFSPVMRVSLLLSAPTGAAYTCVSFTIKNAKRTWEISAVYPGSPWQGRCMSNLWWTHFLM